MVYQALGLEAAEHLVDGAAPDLRVSGSGRSTASCCAAALRMTGRASLSLVMG